MKILITERQLKTFIKHNLNESPIEYLKQTFLDSGKIEQDVFDEVIDVTLGKGSNATWLFKKIEAEIVKSEDVYKFKEYFSIFEKNKKDYPKSDINQYKDKYNVELFISTSIKIRERNIVHTGGDVNNQRNLVSSKGISELKSVGINFLGLVDGLQCFEVPMSLSGNETAFKIYRKHLANCSGRDEGAKIELCTMAIQSYFDTYLKKGPYYVFFNMSDPLSPYQFNYEINQFMDKNNMGII